MAEIFILKDDYDLLNSKLDRLELRSKSLMSKLAEAASHGGSATHGIPEYRAIEYELKINDQSINDLSTTIEKYSLIKNQKPKRINQYFLVKTEHQDTKAMGSYYILDLNLKTPVGLPSNTRQVSPFSPLAQAMLDKKVSQKITFETPKGIQSLKIIAAEFRINT